MDGVLELVEVGGVDACERLKESKSSWDQSWFGAALGEGRQWAQERASWEELVRLRAYCEKNITWSSYGVADAIGGPGGEWGWDEVFCEDYLAEVSRCEGAVKGFCEGALQVFCEVAKKMGAAV